MLNFLKISEKKFINFWPRLLKSTKPIAVPSEFETMSANDGNLEGNNTWRLSTIMDKHKPEAITKVRLRNWLFPLFCVRPPSPNPKGINNIMFSIKSFALLKQINWKRNSDDLENSLIGKVKGNSVAIRIEIKAKKNIPRNNFPSSLWPVIPLTTYRVLLKFFLIDLD